MKGRLSLFFVVALAAGCVQAADFPYQPVASTSPNACYPVTPPVACPPQPIQVTRMVPVTREVEVPRGRWVTETRNVPCNRTVYVNEQYTDYKTKWERRPVTRTRRVNRTVYDNETRMVNETVYETSYDPTTCRTCRVPRTVTRAVTVPVKRKVCVDEQYTDYERYRVQVPVTRTRRVAKTVTETRQVADRRWVTEMVRERVTEMQPVTETVYAPAPPPAQYCPSY